MYVVLIAMTSSISHQERYVYLRPKTPAILSVLSKKLALMKMGECDMCHIGFIIPVNYTNNLGKTYLFHEMKPIIKNLDPNTVMERIFGHGFCEFEIPEH